MPRLEKYSLEKLPQKIKDNTSIDGDNVYIPTVALKESGDLLGAGGQRFVITNPENPEKEVLAFVYQGELSPKHAKQIYYSQKIMSSLFPYNFPKTYAVTAGSFLDKDTIPVEIRQKIVGEHPVDITKFYNTTKNKIIYLFDSLKKILHGKPYIKYPYSKVFDFLNEMGLNDYSGNNENNFINGNDGGQYFVDSLFEAKKDHLSLLTLDQNKLQSYMIKNKYSEHDQRKVLNALKRLKEISIENNASDKNSAL